VTEVTELGDILRTSVARAWEHRHAYRLAPAESSVAAKELRAAQNDARQQETIQTAYSAASMRVVAAEDALRAMAEALDDKPFAVASLARSSLEWCALARWLFERDLLLRDRVARGMTDYIYSLWQVSRVVTDEEERVRLRRRIADERREAEAFGLLVKEAGGWQKGLYFVEERRPTTTALIDQLLRPVAPGLGAFMWQLLSGLSHGTTGFMMEMFKEEDPPSGIDKTGQPFARKSAPQRTSMIAAAAGVGFLGAFGEMTEVNGWDAAAWREWDRRYRPALIRHLVASSK
jgi:hypothetical protein